MGSLRLVAIVTAVVWGVAASSAAAPGADQAPAPTSAQSSTAPAAMSGPAGSRITDTREMVNGAGAPQGPKTAYASVDLKCGDTTYTVSTGTNGGMCHADGKSATCASGPNENGDGASASCEAGCTGSSGAGSCTIKQ